MFIFAQLSFLTTLYLPYQGEEAVYTITSMEMAFHRDWWVPTLYGLNYARPPLMNWLVVPLATLLGWDEVLVASRLVSAAATFFTSCLLMWFVKRISANGFLALLTGVFFISGDVLFRRGWLAYSDPLFALFVFGAMCFLWVATVEQRRGWLALSLLILIGSFLTKALTGYIFFGIAFLLLGYRLRAWKFLLSPWSFGLYVMALGFPVLWQFLLGEGNHGSSMIQDVWLRLQSEDLKRYVVQLLLYPLDTLGRWLPLSALIVYGWFRGPRESQPFVNSSTISLAFWIVFLNYLPYWIAPEIRVRYLLPLFPFMAMILAIIVLEKLPCRLRALFWWLAGCVLLRYIVGLWWFPYYEDQYRGSYEMAARDIERIVENHPLYTTDHSAIGLSVSAYLDQSLMPNSILQAPKGDLTQGFLLSRVTTVPHTQVVKYYYFGSQKLYLLCSLNTCPLKEP